ncbi:MAG TPA: HEAT repeat domain-containing protein [Oligoflexus sp.]|uniref:HEAT repeat domain-containing protein n=1 Tax=Oligoflexus sp. TaxID=1971216 RepID=UPI002D7E6B34|nr:HEAT repeat domain-containing protein [Oligoflexus sp.]HET9236455.1 HEAT repeat domain-containing protein [Oligoflexus sp.]
MRKIFVGIGLATLVSLLAFGWYKLRKNSHVTLPQDSACLEFTLQWKEAFAVQQQDAAQQYEIIVTELAADNERLATLRVRQGKDMDIAFYASLDPQTSAVIFRSSEPPSDDLIRLIYGSLQKMPAWSLGAPLSLTAVPREDLNGIYTENLQFDGKHLRKTKTAYQLPDDSGLSIAVPDSQMNIVYEPHGGRKILSQGDGRERLEIRFRKQDPTTASSSFELQRTGAKSKTCASESSAQMIASQKLIPVTMERYRQAMIETVQASIAKQTAPVSAEVFHQGIKELLTLLDGPETSEQGHRINALYSQSLDFLRAHPEAAQDLLPAIRDAVQKRKERFLNLLSDLLGNVDGSEASAVMRELLTALDEQGWTDQMPRSISSMQFIQHPDAESIEALRRYYEREKTWTPIKDASLLALATLSGRTQQASSLERDLQKQALSSKAQHVRVMAVEGLGNLRQENSVKALQTLSRDPDIDVAVRALRALTFIPFPDSASYFIGRALDTREPGELREQAWKCLSQMKKTSESWARIVDHYRDARQQKFLNAIVQAPGFAENISVQEQIRQLPQLYDWEIATLKAYTPLREGD